MRTTRFGDDQRNQDLYFDHDHPTMPGWFKGMEVIIRERGLWPEKGINAQLECDGFKCEVTTLTGGNLTLRQGATWPPDLGVSVYLFAKVGEELSGKTIEVGPDRPPPIPKVTLRWKDDLHPKGGTQNFTTGYALKVVFGEAANGRIPGTLYIALPDQDKSFIAGTFDAEIRKPPPPKQTKK